MDGLIDAFESVVSRSQQEVNPQKPEDYMGEDGLLYCGVCQRRKQARIQVLGREMVVPIYCQCREEEAKREKEAEEKRRQMQAIARLKSLSLMSDKFRSATLEAYVHRPENEKVYRLAKNYADRFDEMYAENQGLLFYGAIGTGKSYTAACIANALLNRGISVVMTSFVKILQEIKPDGRDEGDYIRGLDNARLLIIDDLGAERNTDYALEKVYNVVDSRVRSSRPMILTTNLSLDAMKSERDIRYKRIYDRIFENCYPLKFVGKSFRTDEGNKRYVRMRELLGGEK